MNYALINRKKERAKRLIHKDENCLCPLCFENVIAKCGEIKLWHFAHINGNDCDSWSEGETSWHFLWKLFFISEAIEVPMLKHRADIYNKSQKLVIEIQNSGISVQEIREREIFYRNMIWIFNAKKYDLSLRYRTDRYNFTFRWKHPSKSIWSCEKPVFFDIGTGILRINKVYHNIPCGGSGNYFNYDTFFNLSFFDGIKEFGWKNIICLFYFSSLDLETALNLFKDENKIKFFDFIDKEYEKIMKEDYDMVGGFFDPPVQRNAYWYNIDDPFLKPNYPRGYLKHTHTFGNFDKSGKEEDKKQTR